VDYGVNINYENNYGQSPLKNALLKNSNKLTNYFIEHYHTTTSYHDSNNNNNNNNSMNEKKLNDSLKKRSMEEYGSILKISFK